MKLSNGASIRVDDEGYHYESDVLNIEAFTLEGFVTDLKYYGVVDEFITNARHDEIFALSSTCFEVTSSGDPEPDLETCYERVIEHLVGRPVENHKEFVDQAEVIGKLKIAQNAISNRTD